MKKNFVLAGLLAVAWLPGVFGATEVLLENGTKTNITATPGTSLYFKMTVPPGQNLLIFYGNGTVAASSSPITGYIGGYSYSVVYSNPTPGEWHFVLSPNSTQAGPIFAAYAQTVTNNQSVTISGAEAERRYFAMSVPAGQTLVSASLTGGSGDPDLYAGKAIPPTPDPGSYDIVSNVSGPEEAVSTNYYAATYWYFLVNGFQSYAGVKFTASHAAEVTPLELGTAITGLSGIQASYRYFKVTVPPGQAALEITHTDSHGDSVVYLRRGSLPDYANGLYDGSTLSGKMIVRDPVAGDYYVMIRAAAAYSNVSIKAMVHPAVLLNNGVAQSSVSGPGSPEAIYKITVPANQTKLNVDVFGGTGVCDLYVQRNASPTTSSYAAYSLGTTNHVSIRNPAAGDWYILLHALNPFAGRTLAVSYEQKLGMTKLAPISNVVQVQWDWLDNGGPYQLQVRTNFVNDTWRNIGGSLAVTNYSDKINGSGAAFYRVVTAAPAPAP